MVCFVAFSFQRGDARPRIHSEVILVTEQIITQEAFVAGLSRTMDLQRTDVAVAMGLETRLIDYLHEARLRSNSSGSTELVVSIPRSLAHMYSHRGKHEAARP
jgi:hypothetical protein